MIQFERVRDISVRLGDEHIDYPGDEPFSLAWSQSFSAGDDCAVSSLKMSAHAGAHLDLPAHFVPGGRTLDDFPLDRFILPARILAPADPERPSPEDVLRNPPRPGGAVLFRTANSLTGLAAAGRLSREAVFLSPEAARACLAAKAGLVGWDYLSVDPLDSADFPAHRVLLGAGVPILEGLNLRGVPAGEYTLLCLPLSIKGAEASPVRAVLLK